MVFFSTECIRQISTSLGLTGRGFLGGCGLSTRGACIVKITYQPKQKDHMESLFHMVYLFLCPQGGALYTDNGKLRGGKD